MLATPDKTASPATVRLKSFGCAFPPLLFCTTLVSVSFGPTSSLVIIHEMSSPSSKVMVPPSTDGHSASPVSDTNS